MYIGINGLLPCDIIITEFVPTATESKPYAGISASKSVCEENGIPKQESKYCIRAEITSNIDNWLQIINSICVLLQPINPANT